MNYDSIWSELVTYCQTWKSILVPSSCVYSPGASKKIFDLVPDKIRISRPSPIIYLKAKKNPVEIEGMEKAHIRDGAAMCKFFEYFETRVSFIFIHRRIFVSLISLVSRRRSMGRTKSCNRNRQI